MTVGCRFLYFPRVKAPTSVYIIGPVRPDPRFHLGSNIPGPSAERIPQLWRKDKG